ncbi:hypothetical protein [Actinobacillus equuli]|uniref:hypothetical protein n=1 Tax=Actinobacillus equuli TaxID=718 RepID=UPI00244313D7|nr:hypothetical protein [Actinobacillus equuli]WGE42294.1 hypothetical protein NYR64_00100 [Actinobacillus equuli subsp. haemolyticus]WGE53012.1 hypothetical protein NYR69_00100 [Actinobacillus equuli subsp. haemolyticus]
MFDILARVFSTDNFSSLSSPVFLWLSILVLFIVTYKAGNGKFNPPKYKFSLSKNINEELNLSYLQICTFAIGVYILAAIFEGISTKGVAILFSGMSVYISIFGFRILRKAKIKIHNNSLNKEKLKSKLENKEVNINEALKRIDVCINLIMLFVVILFFVNVSILIYSYISPIDWLWIISYCTVMFGFFTQSMIILIENLVIKE